MGHTCCDRAVSVKTTLDIKDDLLLRAKKLAKRTGRPLRAVVEDSLRLTLANAQQRPDYRLPDLSVGRAGDVDPLELLTWQDLRAIVYGEPDAR